jgi:acetylglutamate/LysW-gamma-L-alpha-aminoadipate kinase
MIIVKIGGGKTINIEGIIADLSLLQEQFIIVHGANELRNELSDLLHVNTQIITSVSGVSSVYTDDKGIDLLMLAYAGLRNKRIVEICQKYGINAVGLTGLDAKLIQGQRNKGIRVFDNGKVKLKHDRSGKPATINKKFLFLLLNNGYTPVITVPIIDEYNQAINSENDDIVALLQTVVPADLIIQLIEAPGYLEKANDPNSLLLSLSKEQLQEQLEKVQGRIKRKIMSLIKLFEYGKVKIIIADGRVEHPIKNALEHQRGTIIS